MLLGLATQVSTGDSRVIHLSCQELCLRASGGGERKVLCFKILVVQDCALHIEF